MQSTTGKLTFINIAFKFENNQKKFSSVKIKIIKKNRIPYLSPDYSKVDFWVNFVAALGPKF